MKKMFFLFTALLLFACSQPAKVDPNAEQVKKIATLYSGTLPCADCEGIAYALVLKPDMTYEARLTYRGKSAEPVVHTGKWKLEGNKVTLDKPTEGMNQFEVGEKQLAMLDLSGNKITGALADLYKLYVPEEGAPAPQLSIWAKKYLQGTDFVAMGNEPSWSLDMDFDKGIRFKSLSADSLNTPPVMAKNWRDGVLTYEAKTEAGSMTVTISKQPCADNMSGENFDYTVTVKTKTSEYKGCGRYLRGSLGSLWTLKSMNGAAIDAKTYMKGAPVLQIDAKEGRYAGNDGCNMINGKLKREGMKITFEKGVSTMMACPGNGPDDYAKALFGATEYKLTDTELTLLTDGKPVLVYGL
jgi:uncharacterized membrane protein/heat shock protein HslJ/uncharacterized lipoprotein NlpE involved in copper resistance